MGEFVIYPDAALSRKATPRPVDARMLEAGARLLAAAEGVHAYGLAAAHLGLDEPLVVISIAPATAPRDYRVLYNPKVIDLAPESETGMEGSVSLPGIEVPVVRSTWTVLAHDDAAGQSQNLRVEGFVARVAQHEIDQMNGLFFLRRVSSVKRDLALRKFRKTTR
ncbi:MAG: peptide deformylase [Alphaproteobacteria bacterium]|nr:peptide deformylase [Alphaproteobacteria bacterium]MBU1560923.1 peptide deformylase [Alphaproteobacteria bacterium]MBU2304897.1 peptide deformylase [Alphaproteobacteria bacterium]MBU2370148.1 peptide deformylase [Alphaproteobacteria bacterium]